MKVFLLTVSVWLCLGHILTVAAGLENLRPTATPKQQESAVRKLLKRNFGTYQSQINVKVDPTLANENEEKSMIEPSKNPYSFGVIGSSASAVAFGVQSYLRNCCQIHISWEGSQIRLPKIIPQPKVNSNLTSFGRFRYYANICTFSYSFVYWDWPKWESHIDWLALNGVNLVLMPVGQEYLWLKVFAEVGLSKNESLAYITGSAFLAWNRMGNLKKWNGPLSVSWLKRQLKLGQQIVRRFVDLGIIPVFPGFAGHLPDGFKQLYPEADLTALKPWIFNCTYSCTLYLNPIDPLYAKIQRSFINQLNLAFGNVSHAYNIDPFNEMEPKSFDKNYISNLSRGIYESLQSADSKAIWVMQGWMFLNDKWLKTDAAEALMKANPIGSILALDLFSEQIPIYPKTQSYYGQPFIWCFLHNFGGNLGIWGAVDATNQGVSDGMAYANSSMVGTGLTMEGIYQNYPIYQFMLDRSWSQTPLDKNQWIRNYIAARYGHSDEILQNIWVLLWNSLYNEGESVVQGEFLILKRPSLTLTQNIPFNISVLFQAWSAYFERIYEYETNDLFKHDMVDITRELLSNIAAQFYTRMVNGYKSKSERDFGSAAKSLLKLLLDLDESLSLSKDFLLGPWLQQAKLASDTQTEADQFEFGLKNQISLWGPKGEIVDYARKQWAGVVRDYYYPRWAEFSRDLFDSLTLGTNFSQTDFNLEVLNEVEIPFGSYRKNYPTEPKGDFVSVMYKIFNRYILADSVDKFSTPICSNDTAIQKILKFMGSG